VPWRTPVAVYKHVAATESACDALAKFIYRLASCLLTRRVKMGTKTNQNQQDRTRLQQSTAMRITVESWYFMVFYASCKNFALL
jgi:hypothetical protein